MFGAPGEANGCLAPDTPRHVVVPLGAHDQTMAFSTAAHCAASLACFRSGDVDLASTVFQMDARDALACLAKLTYHEETLHALRTAFRHAVATDAELCAFLWTTRDLPLVYASDSDTLGAVVSADDGTPPKGRNLVGLAWMEVRAALFKKDG